MSTLSPELLAMLLNNGQPRPQAAPVMPSPVAQFQTPMQAPAAPQQQPRQFPAPDFSPINSTPAPAMPAEQRLAQIQPLDPNDPKYHNSKLRTVLNAIAGGLAGAAGGPEAGMRVGSQLHDMKYNRDVQRQQQQLEVLKPQVQSEQHLQQVGVEGTRAGVQRGAAQGLEVHRENQDAAAGVRANATADDTKSKIAHRKSLEEYTKWKQDNPKLDDLQYILGLEGDDQKEAIATLKDLKTAGQKTPEQIRKDSEARTAGSIDAQNTPAGRQVAAGRTTATVTAHDAVEAAQATPEVIQSYKDVMEQDPATAWATLKALPQAARSKIMKEAGVPTSLPAREGERLFNSRITLNHVESAEKMVQDPDIKKLLGPLSGRIELLKGRIGTGESDSIKLNADGLPNDQAFKMGRLVNFLNYMIVWESTTLSGTRPAQRLIESLRGTGASPEKAYTRFMGALQAIKDSVGNTERGILKRHGGKVDKASDDGFDWGSIKVNK